MDQKRLRMRVQVGIDVHGNNIISSRTFSNLKLDATDEALGNVGTVIAGLIEHPVESFTRIDEFVL